MSEDKLTCPHCGSHKVRSYDGTLCWHPSQKECEEDENRYGWVENQQQFYMTCDECNETHQIDATIIVDSEFTKLKEKAEAYDELKSGKKMIGQFKHCLTDDEALQFALNWSDDVRVVADSDSAWIEPVSETIQETLDGALYTFKTYEGWSPMLGLLIKKLGLEIMNA